MIAQLARGRAPLVKEHGEDIRECLNIKDDSGRTCLDLAVQLPKEKKKSRQKICAAIRPFM